MKHHISLDYGAQPNVNIDELDKQVQLSSQEIKNITKQLDDKVKMITESIDHQNTRVDHLAQAIDKQNVIILGIQKEFQATMQDFSSRL